MYFIFNVRYKTGRDPFQFFGTEKTFFEIFLMSSKWMLKKPKGPPFTFFGIVKLKIGFLSGPAHYIRTFDVISEVYCVLLWRAEVRKYCADMRFL